MSRLIQIRRGTADEHETFTGAIGEVTMDTTNKTLRVHDGETAGGTALAKQSALDAADYVIESQRPTAENNYTWYRKYKSGWVEQGGKINITSNAISATNTRVTFPVKMCDTKYFSIASQDANAGGTPRAAVGWQSTTAMSIGFISGTGTVAGEISWLVQGFMYQE